MPRHLRLALVLDTLALGVAVVVTSEVVLDHPLPWVARPHAWGMLGAIALGAAIALFIAFRSQVGGVWAPSYGRALSMAGIMLGVTAISLVLLRTYWSRGFVLGTTLLWLALNLLTRFVRRRHPWVEPMVLITHEKALIQDLLVSRSVDVIGVLDPGGLGPDEPLLPGTVLAVDLRAVLSEEMARFVSSSSLAGYPMRSLVSLYEEHTGRLPIVHLMEGWELTVPLANKGVYVSTKRVIDTMAVILTAPLALVLGLLIAAAIALESRGRVIFRQQRVGRGGDQFTLYKFRTMRDGADQEGARFASPGDDRLTRVGRLLRRSRIDELPQLWNVLVGDLSLVGPRPEQGPFSEEFSQTIPFYSHRQLVRPGLTGWAQVNFGYADNEADTIEKLSYDLYYIKHMSPWLDLEILGRSVWTVVSGFGAR
jgi:lipopolysaccharide/colanic/teichoic acid biosynthesis glycosyltransferase